jgi:hypothetical protein
MAFTPSEKAEVLVGALRATAYARTAAFSGSFATHDVTTLADRAVVVVPTLSTSSFTVGGPLDVDTTVNGQYDLLKTYAANATSAAITYGEAGLAAGARTQMLDAWQTSFNVPVAVAGGSDWSVTALATGAFDYGVSLEPLTAVTIDGNGTARDNGAATANGGVAHLHVTAFSGLTNNIVTIEHSVDGSTAWATLVTFATYTGITSERVVVAAGTTVRRYLRVVDNVTGTGSTTRSVSFARR